MEWKEIMGFVGGAMTTGAFVPQVWRLFRLRSAREISLPFTVLLLAGGLCWLSYGFVLMLPPVILWNAISVSLVAAMLYAKLRYGKS